LILGYAIPKPIRDYKEDENISNFNGNYGDLISIWIIIIIIIIIISLLLELRIIMEKKALLPSLY
jgi:hypothetical protein